MNIKHFVLLIRFNFNINHDTTKNTNKMKYLKSLWCNVMRNSVYFMLDNTGWAKKLLPAKNKSVIFLLYIYIYLKKNFFTDWSI